MQDITTFIEHHWMLNIAFFSILFFLILIEFAHQKRKAIQASPAEVTQLINRSRSALIDLREKTAYTDGHIIGSVSIPATEVTNQTKKLEKLKARPVILVCQQGAESVRTADQLIKQGYDIRILAGGINAWRKADMPLVKE